MKTTICATVLLAFAAFSECAWARSIYVDVNAPPGGDGTRSAPVQTIAKALEQAREIRKNESSRIVVHVAPGVYNENFPIYLNISNLALRGSTRFIDDDDDELPGNCGTERLPAPCVEPSTETLITPLVPLPIGQSLFTVGPTKDNPVANLTNITISRFIFDGKGDNVTATSGRSIFVDRTANFIIDHNVLRHGAPALTTRMSSGSIQNNFAHDDLDGFAVAAGSEIYPARVKLVANRSINVTVNGSMGALAIGAANGNQVDPNLEPVQSVYDPSLHPEQVPDKLVIFVIGNDFSGNMFGFRFEQYGNFSSFYDTTDNQPMTSNFRAIVRDNLCRNNAEYGFLVEGAFPTRSNPRKFTGTFNGSFEDNDCSGTGRAGVFVGFMVNGVVTRNPGNIKTYKYLQDSSFTLRLDDESLSSGLDYDNPVLDPADNRTPLNNQLTINGDTFTGKRVTCPPGFPCVP
jgi:hypothetical protein